MAENRGLELRPEALRHVCDPHEFRFADTSELPLTKEPIGQERAVRAIQFGIGIESPGYHMYALGPVGTGKTSMIRAFLEKKAADQPAPDDWCYVNNFTDPAQPLALRLPAGKGRDFQTDIHQLIEDLRAEIPRIFQSEDYRRQRDSMTEHFETEAKALLDELETKARSKGFAVMRMAEVLAFTPIVDNKVLTPDQVGQLDEDTRERIDAEADALKQEASDIMERGRSMEQTARSSMMELDRSLVRLRADRLLAPLREKYDAVQGAASYLDNVRDDIVDNLDSFRQREDEAAALSPAMLFGKQDAFQRYQINLLVDNSRSSGAPIVFEENPHYHNLLGRVEYEMRFGAMVTQFTMIKAGALHRANGGYLMLKAQDILTKPFAWNTLKRALRSQQIRVSMMGEELQAVSMQALEPEPIPLDVKVIVIGDLQLYTLLYGLDEEFHELFKVKADFADHMDWTPEAIQSYAVFIGTVCQEEKLRPFDPSGVARVIEESARMVADQNKLATRFGDIVDLVRQSSYWAEQNNGRLVTSQDVQQALDERTYRSNKIENVLRALIQDGTLKIDTEGCVVGQVNGISVLSMGDYAFGKPSRITARTYVGSAGMVHIDRETELGGRIHNKGMMILVGYLGGKYAQENPLALSASLTFEQLYEEVEGDSAAAAELYALLSSLSGMPIRQDLAVTGSVDQHGHIQAIGGVNEKVEGFFDVCRGRGLTGTQGVIIPRSNAGHLMLRPDVVEAVREGKFHVYTVETADDGIALLTGHPAGEIAPDGLYPEGTVNRAVQQRLETLATSGKTFAEHTEMTG